MRKVLVRNPGSGRVLPCCWDTCEVSGDARIALEVVDGVFTDDDGVSPLLVGTPKKLTYIFCRERHREYWKNSHRDHGNLPSGARTPLG